MGKMHCLAETAAVHHRVENQQRCRNQQEEAHDTKRSDSNDFPPQTGNQCGTDHGLEHGKGDSNSLCGKVEKTDMQETVILLHYQGCPHRIEQFQNP